MSVIIEEFSYISVNFFECVNRFTIFIPKIFKLFYETVIFWHIVPQNVRKKLIAPVGNEILLLRVEQIPADIKQLFFCVCKFFLSGKKTVCCLIKIGERGFEIPVQVVHRFFRVISDSAIFILRIGKNLDEHLDKIVGTNDRSSVSQIRSIGIFLDAKFMFM